MIENISLIIFSQQFYALNLVDNYAKQTRILFGRPNLILLINTIKYTLHEFLAKFKISTIITDLSKHRNIHLARIHYCHQNSSSLFGALSKIVYFVNSL